METQSSAPRWLCASAKECGTPAAPHWINVLLGRRMNPSVGRRRCCDSTVPQEKIEQRGRKNPSGRIEIVQWHCCCCRRYNSTRPLFELLGVVVVRQQRFFGFLCASCVAMNSQEEESFHITTIIVQTTTLHKNHILYSCVGISDGPDTLNIMFNVHVFQCRVCSIWYPCTYHTHTDCQSMVLLRERHVIDSDE